MSQDILFKSDEAIFSYRVGGILIHDRKVLLQKPKNDDYAIIGGHVNLMETAQEALVREYYEETGAHIVVDELFAVSEIFFTWMNKPCHQICLYYFIHLIDAMIPLTGSFSGKDDEGKTRIDLDYIWVDLEELKKGLKVYPLEIIPYILEKPEHVVHFISNDLESI